MACEWQAGTHRPEPEHLGPENKKEDDHFPLNYSFWIDTRQCQATTNMKQEGERNTCLHKFEAIEGETRQWDLMGNTVENQKEIHIAQIWGSEWEPLYLYRRF